LTDPLKHFPFFSLCGRCRARSFRPTTRPLCYVLKTGRPFRKMVGPARRARSVCSLKFPFVPYLFPPSPPPVVGSLFSPPPGGRFFRPLSRRLLRTPFFHTPSPVPGATRRFLTILSSAASKHPAPAVSKGGSFYLVPSHAFPSSFFPPLECRSESPIALTSRPSVSCSKKSIVPFLVSRLFDATKNFMHFLSSITSPPLFPACRDTSFVCFPQFRNF